MTIRIASPCRTAYVTTTYDRLMERTDDTELVERLMSRDERALSEAIERFGPSVLAVAQRVVAELHYAQEVSQDVFLALWRRPGAFDPARGSLLRFLCGVARNKAIDLVRREESLRRAQDVLIGESSSTFVSKMPAIEETQVVANALKELSESQREALVLAYFGGRTYREVAIELGIPEGTAKTRLRDGLMRLRAVLAEQGESR